MNCEETCVNLDLCLWCVCALKPLMRILKSLGTGGAIFKGGRLLGSLGARSARLRTNICNKKKKKKNRQQAETTLRQGQGNTNICNMVEH